MKIDFRKIEVKDVEGNVLLTEKGEVDYKDVHTLLGNAIHFGVSDIANQEIGRDIYLNGEVEVTPETAVVIRHFVDKTLLAFVKVELLPVLDNIINSKKITSC